MWGLTGELGEKSLLLGCSGDPEMRVMKVVFVNLWT